MLNNGFVFYWKNNNCQKMTNSLLCTNKFQLFNRPVNARIYQDHIRVLNSTFMLAGWIWINNRFCRALYKHISLDYHMWGFNSELVYLQSNKLIPHDHGGRQRGTGRPCPPPPWIFIHDTDIVDRGLIVLFSVLFAIFRYFSVAPPPLLLPERG